MLSILARKGSGLEPVAASDLYHKVEMTRLSLNLTHALDIAPMVLALPSARLSVTNLASGQSDSPTKQSSSLWIFHSVYCLRLVQASAIPPSLAVGLPVPPTLRSGKFAQWP